MQTFLPFTDFRESAEALDDARLGKQRVETLQILRALELPEYGWANHPAVIMWRGRVPALVLYGLICARAWMRRGHADSTYDQMAEFAPEVAGRTQDDLAARGELPSWLGDPRLHLSHRSKLLAKDPAHYGVRFAGVPADLEYHWPGADPAAPSDSTPAGVPLWVVPTASPAELGTCVEHGFVALGTGSGMTTDATGHEIADLQAALGLSRRRTKPLVALSRFVNEIAVGDRIGVFVDRRRKLLVGVVTGDYRWVADAVHQLPHRRSVAFDGVIARGDIAPPASLQDVRPLFRVRLRP